MINHRVIDSAKDPEQMKRFSHWYCDSSKIDQNFILGMKTRDFVPPTSDDLNYWSGFDSNYNIKADLIYYIQQNIRYYLRREMIDNSYQEEGGTSFMKDIKDHTDDLLSILFVNKYGREDGTEDVFQINIPNRKVTLQVSKTVLSRESKVFERMLNSEMIEARTGEMNLVDRSDKYFEWMIEYLHTGHLGVDKITFESGSINEKEVTVTMDDLIGLLQVADEYQVESLTRSISKVCNMYNALTMALASLELSEDCKSIINDEAIPIISEYLECVICDPIYKKVDPNELEEDTAHYLSLDKSTIIQEIREKIPYLTEKDIFPMVRYIDSKKPHQKVIGKIPFELFKEILLNFLVNENTDTVIDLLVVWTLANYEERFEESCKFLIDFIDFSIIGDEFIFTIYTIFVNAGNEDIFSTIKSKLKDCMLKALFKKSGIPKHLLGIEEKEPLNGKKPFSLKKMNGIMIGLDAAGKTTILYKLSLGEVVFTVPTENINTQTISFRKAEITIKDFGGLSNLWREHAKDIDFLIFVIDSIDVDRMSQAKDHLYSALDIIPSDCPVLLLANKQDLMSAVSVANIVTDMHLHTIFSHRQWFIQACCAISGDGLFEGIEWLSTCFVPDKVEHFGNANFFDNCRDLMSVLGIDESF